MPLISILLGNNSHGYFPKFSSSDKDNSQASLPLSKVVLEQKSSLPQETKASTEDFHLSLPQYETPERETSQTSVPGSSSSLDELCGRKKNKSDKDERFSKLSKKLFGKKDREGLEQADGIFKSTENIPNGKDATVEESEVNIDICPIDHAPDSEEPDINIYPLDQAVPLQAEGHPPENHSLNGLDKQDAVLQMQDSSDCPGGTMNHADNGAMASSGNKQSASDELYQQVLSGNMDVRIPNLAKIVRIFISSTFTGSKQLHVRCCDIYFQ